MRVYQFNPPMKVRVSPVVGRFLGIGASDEVDAPTAMVLRRHEYEGEARGIDYFKVAIPTNSVVSRIHYSIVEPNPNEQQEHQTYIVRTPTRAWKVRIVTEIKTQTTWVWVDEEPQPEATD